MELREVPTGAGSQYIRRNVSWYPAPLSPSAVIYGGGGRIRTSEVVRRQIYSLFPLATREPLQRRLADLMLNGAGDGTRTRNLLITSQLLCQLSYASANNFYTLFLADGQANIGKKRKLNL